MTINYNNSHQLALPFMPLKVLYHDDVLVVQTLAYGDEQDLSTQMLTEGVPSYGRFNLGLHVEDDAQQVLSNRCSLMAQLTELTESKVTQIHWLNQVHGNTVVDVDDFANSRKPNLIAKNADALTSMQAGQALAIMTADCVPIMMYDQKTRRIAGVHAGWQGLANGIIANTLQGFKVSSDSDDKTTSNIQAWIGSCISVDNYEVSIDVLDKLINGTLENFPNLCSNLNREQLIDQITKPHNNPDKTWIDLPMLAKMQLESLGVQVMTNDVPCSYGNPMYYSHRRATHKQQGNTGRMAMLIVKI